MLVTIATAIFVVAFAILWGPRYFANSNVTLFLYPLVFLSLPLIGILAIVGIVLGARGLGERGQAKGKHICAVIGGVLLVTLSFPVLWFGDTPLVIFGG